MYIAGVANLIIDNKCDLVKLKKIVSVCLYSLLNHCPLKKKFSQCYGL